MGTINFDTSNKTFREILGNGLKYEVPRFQRDYAWTEEQWSDLWQDIEEVIQEQDDEHYMGYLVLQRINDNTSIIIDGQQRLTTVTLIIIAALYQLKELVENKDHPEDNQRRLEALQRSYIGALNPVSLTVENKLQLNRNNQSYFKTYLASLQKSRASPVSSVLKSSWLMPAASSKTSSRRSSGAGTRLPGLSRRWPAAFSSPLSVSAVR